MRASRLAIREMAALRTEGKALWAMAKAMQAKGFKISHEGAKGRPSGPQRSSPSGVAYSEDRSSPCAGLASIKAGEPLAAEIAAELEKADKALADPLQVADRLAALAEERARP